MTKVFIFLLILLALPSALAQEAQIAQFQLNARPVDIAASFDENFIYVFTSQSHVLRINADSGTIVQTMLSQEGLPDGLSIDDDYEGFVFELNPLDNSATISCQRNGIEAKKVVLGDTPAQYVVSGERLFVANQGDNTISVHNIPQIVNDIEPCQRSYFTLFLIALIGTVVFFIIMVLLGIYHVNLIQEEKKLAKFILDHLDKGHHLEDIHTHLHKYSHPDRVHGATRRAYHHMDRVKQGKKGLL